MRRLVLAALATALSVSPAACSPPSNDPAPARVPDEEFAPAKWETSWSKDELATWREGVVANLPPRGDPHTQMGAPIEGALVELVVPQPEGRVTANDVVCSAVTGADGRFRVGPGPSQSWILRVSKAGLAPIWVGSGRAEELRGVVEPIGGPSFRVGLRPAVEVRGEVVDEAGRPVAGARLVSASIAYREELTTDDAGRFVAHVPGGSTILETEDPRWSARPVRAEVRIGEPPPKPVIRAHATEPLHGWVATAEGHSISDAIVLCVEDPSIRTRSGADGRFEIRVSRAHHVAAFTGGYGWHSAAVPRAGELELNLHPVEGIHGRVVDAEGRPVEDARLTAVVMNYEGLFERVVGPRTRSDGSFDFSWLPRPPRGLPSPPRYLAMKRGLGESAVASAEAHGGTSDVRLVLLGTRDLDGRAVRGDGSPVPGAFVEAQWGRWEGGVTEPESAAFGLALRESTHSGPDGRWKLEDVPLGLHAKVQCTAESVVLERFVEGPEAARPFDFVFEGGLPLAGRVVDSAGKPPEGTVRVTVQLLNAEGVATHQGVVAGADGSFRFEKLPRGEYQIRVEGDRYDLAGGGVATAGSDSAVVKIERSASLTVRFAFDGGRAPDVPLAFSLLPAEGGSQQFRQTIAPVRGGEPITLQGIYPGTWKLELSGDVWRASIDDLVLADGARRELDVPVHRTLRVPARLLDGDGKPLARQLVVVAPLPPRTGPPQAATSGADGALDITGLSPGRWLATCDPPKLASLRAEFDVKDGANAPVELRLPRSGTIVVRVAKDNGDPIAGAVAVLTASDGTSVDAWDDAGSPMRTNRFRTNAEGIATIVGVRVGTVHVEVRSDPERLKSADVEVAAGKAVNVDVP